MPSDTDDGTADRSSKEAFTFDEALLESALVYVRSLGVRATSLSSDIGEGELIEVTIQLRANDGAGKSNSGSKDLGR